MSARAGLKKSRKSVNLCFSIPSNLKMLSVSRQYINRVTSEPSNLVVLNYLHTIKCALKTCSKICRASSFVWEETGQYSEAMHGTEQVKQDSPVSARNAELSTPAIQMKG